MLSCKEAAQLISESLDNQLPLSRRLALRMHLLMCKFCSRYWKQMHFLRKTLHYCSEHVEETQYLPEASLSQEARARIKKILREGS
ncbi:MAG: zf-HC2 domain-containing protein [Deltaproteobacteria bacterium]|nr:zf-HC2 domain-containing protein [Deltaproteobacteria bacterium]MBW2072223.1 zf-HC2 domain-containing protein [Deltaproteobacteria bacterium]